VATKVLTLLDEQQQLLHRTPASSGSAAGAPRNRTASGSAPDGRVRSSAPAISCVARVVVVRHPTVHVVARSSARRARGERALRRLVSTNSGNCLALATAHR